MKLLYKDAPVKSICLTHIGKTFELLRMIEPERRGTVLNVGSGYGEHTKLLTSLNYKVISVDVDPTSIYHAANSTDNLFVVGDATSLPFRNGIYDYAVCIDVLEHVEDDKKAIFELYRVIKKGGKTIISVPMKNYPFIYDPINKILSWVGVKPLRIGLYAWGHKRLYTDDELTEKIKSQQFQIVEKSRFNSIIISSFESYIPYIYAYILKPVFNKTNLPLFPFYTFFQKLGILLYSLDRRFFYKKLGYVNLMLKIKKDNGYR